MKPRTKKALKIGLVALPIILVLHFVFATWQAARHIANNLECQSNLRYIGLAVLTIEHDDADARSPTNLQALTSHCTDPATFICPHTGHKSGALSKVDQWSDYVLVADVGKSFDKRIKVKAYCIPEHHDKRSGNVLFTDGSVEWVLASNFWQTVRDGRAE